jgi:hypothetical protein
MKFWIFFQKFEPMQGLPCADRMILKLHFYAKLACQDFCFEILNELVNDISRR